MTTPSIVRQLHASLTTHAPDQLITILQEAGYAAGEGLYKAFAAVNNPTDLDADLLGETLSEFFANGGWGTVAVSPVANGALAPDSGGWGEANPRTPPTPVCFFSPRLPAAFLGRPSAETGAGVEGRGPSRGHERGPLLSVR